MDALTTQGSVAAFYQKLLECWNNQNATGFANLFAKDGNAIGFDGSQMNGRQEIDQQISQVFKHHKVSSYIGIVREVRLLSPTVFVLRAVAGMIAPGQSNINPAVNAIQTLVIQKEKEDFCIAVFQNTPAAFHERPELKEQLTKELQEAFNKKQQQ